MKIKNHKLDRILLAFVALVFLIVSFFTISSVENKRKTILFIAKSDQSSFWKLAFEGALSAGKELGANIIIKAPDTEEDYETQNMFIKQGIEDGVDGIIFSAIDFNSSVSYIEDAIVSGISVISVDSFINLSGDLLMIGTDNFNAGKQVGQEIANLMDYSGELAIVNFEKGSFNGSEREKGVIASIANYPNIDIVEIVYTLSNIKSSQEITEMILTKYPSLKGIVTFNEWTTLGVSEAIKKFESSHISVIGFDQNIKSIQDLESGIIDGLIVQNSFAMGYLGVKHMMDKKIKTGFIDTETIFITSENMYDRENQKLVFPVIQK